MIKGLRDIDPYVAGYQPKEKGIIKLNTNENAYGPSPEVLRALVDFDASALRNYSSLSQEGLRQRLGQQLGVDPEQIVVGNGSDDILSMAFLAFFNSSEPIIFPDITYGFYKVWADLYHIPYREIPLDEDFNWRLEDYQQESGGIILTNPNAPTGLYRELTDIEQVLKANPEVVVIVDEAYINFGGQSALSLLKTYSNLFITRTFSKDASLAGMRVGYGVGSPELVSVINAVKNSVNPYNVDAVAESLASAAVDSWSYYSDNCRKIATTRDWFTQELQAIGYKVLPSATNFILVEPQGISASDLFDWLQSKGVYVRYFSKVERLKSWLRISIGTQTDMQRVLDLIYETLT